MAGGLGPEDIERREPRADTIEEHTDLLLENNDQRDSTDRDNAVEERSGEIQLEDKTDQEPDENKRQNTPEEVGGSRAAEKPVGVIEDRCYQDNIYGILESERKSKKLHKVI